MNEIQRRVRFGAIKGLLYMRIQEVMTASSLLRSGIALAISFGLLMLLKLDPNEATEKYSSLVGKTFALWFLPIYCLTKGGESLRSELKDGTIEYLWVRPANKVELYFGFYLSSLLGIFSIVGPSLVGISLAGFAIGAIDVSGLLSLWLGVAAIVASFTAISGALSSFSSKFVVLGIFYYSFVELGLERIPNGIQQLALTYHAKQLLAGMDGYGSGFGIGALTWIVGIGLCGVILGAAIFSQSRYIAGSEKES